MPKNLKRRYGTGKLHFITFSCYGRLPFLRTVRARNAFLIVLNEVRGRYRFVIIGYVVMPEHVHLLMSEPERSTLAVVLQMLKQAVARMLKVPGGETPFWQPRYYDFNVWSERKFKEKLRYIHRNPVTRTGGEARGLEWISFVHYAAGMEILIRNRVGPPQTLHRKNTVGGREYCCIDGVRRRLRRYRGSPG